MAEKLIFSRSLPWLSKYKYYSKFQFSQVYFENSNYRLVNNDQIFIRILKGRICLFCDTTVDCQGLITTENRIILGSLLKCDGRIFFKLSLNTYLTLSWGPCEHKIMLQFNGHNVSRSLLL